MGPCYNGAQLYSAAEVRCRNGADELITEV